MDNLFFDKIFSKSSAAELSYEGKGLKSKGFIKPDLVFSSHLLQTCNIVAIYISPMVLHCLVKLWFYINWGKSI